MAEESLVSCKICGLTHRLPEVETGYALDCSLCGHELKRRTPYSLALTAAFSLCALLFYFPANLFPILKMSMFGRITENTIFTGVIRFYQDGDYFVAIVVFLASILIPFLKIIGLILLVVSTRIHSQNFQPFRTKLYQAVETLGRWAMLDVFAVAVLISLIKLGRLANVVGGKGAFSFVMVVIFTILASASFDPQMIWEEKKS